MSKCLYQSLSSSLEIVKWFAKICVEEFMEERNEWVRFKIMTRTEKWKREGNTRTWAGKRRRSTKKGQFTNMASVCGAEHCTK